MTPDVAYGLRWGEAGAPAISALGGLRGRGVASFDVIYLNAVFHWFPEKRAPIANFRRLLKRGGRLGLATGSKEHANRIHDIYRKVLARAPYRDHAAPDSGLPHRVTPEELRALLTEGGFSVALLELEPHLNHHASAEAAVEHARASSFGNFLGHLLPPLRERARGEILAEVEVLRTPQGIPQGGERIVASAVKS